MQKDVFYTFFNGVIFGQNQERLPQLVLKNGEVATEYPRKDAVKCDLRGKTLMPAFADPHIHLWKVGCLLTHILDVRHCTSIEDIQRKIMQFDEKNPKNSWIIARGFNEQNLEEKRFPTSKELSACSDKKPIFLQRTCAHIAVVNEFALRKCGITAQTPAPQGGKIGYDTYQHPNGVLYETAMALATKHFAPYTQAEYAQMIRAAQKELLRYGVTAATDPAVSPEILEVYHALNAKNRLLMQTEAIAICLPDGENAPFPLPEKYKNGALTVRAVKFFADGGLSGKTAAISTAYKNDPENKGILRLDKKQFLELAQQAHNHGYQIATHAIGDEAIDVVLEIYDKVLKNSDLHMAHRIEHLGLPNTKQLKKIKELGIIVVSQPIFINELGDNFLDYLPEKFLTNEEVYPFKAILDAEIPLWFSTDAPVVKNLNPFVGIQAALTRQTNSRKLVCTAQTINLKQALIAYTAHSNGYIILNKNPYETPINELDAIRVEKIVANVPRLK